nr:hypothetical protein [Tanacetum cinerariifolium]
MRQRHCLELLKDYDTNIQYHPGKANVVADALSRKSGMIAGIRVEEEIIRDLERLDIEIFVRRQHEAHSSLFSVHPGSTKMYHDFKQYFWWSGMKLLDIPVWKWDEISMDFVTGLPQTQRRHDAIWV